MSNTTEEIKKAIDSFEIDHARELVRDALRSHPSAEIYYYAALVAVNNSQKKNFLRKAIELHPFHTEAHEELQKLESSLQRDSYEKNDNSLLLLNDAVRMFTQKEWEINSNFKNEVILESWPRGGESEVRAKFLIAILLPLVFSIIGAVIATIIIANSYKKKEIRLVLEQDGTISITGRTERFVTSSLNEILSYVEQKYRTKCQPIQNFYGLTFLIGTISFCLTMIFIG